ncbi:MAG: DUF3078 domain-containing protein [Crocinitomicaceae bacterium]|jgi:hypothetical protein|nr:DUF3078 domain-containing protein [Crocinitomicaceae bacterium]
MKFLLLLLTITFSSWIFAQNDSLATFVVKKILREDIDAKPLPGPWKLKAIYGLNGSQTSFKNWNAGGQNNVSALGFVSAQAKYSKGDLKWDNDLNLAIGGLQYTSKELTARQRRFQKTDDRLEASSNLGYRIGQKWYLSFNNGFRTQFLDGFNYPNDSVKVSTFMAPGYLNMGLGLDYTANDNFTLYFSPLTAKMTWVQSQRLADKGAFGVQKAVYDDMGVLLSPGKMFRGEFGSYIKMKYNKNLAKNIDLKTKLELFSNYTNNPQNIDVNAEVLWSFKVNSWFQASLQWLLIYDDDIDITDADGNIGPRTQFKSVLGIGISYTMKNFEEKKK